MSNIILDVSKIPPVYTSSNYKVEITSIDETFGEDDGSGEIGITVHGNNGLTYWAKYNYKKNIWLTEAYILLVDAFPDYIIVKSHASGMKYKISQNGVTRDFSSN